MSDVNIGCVYQIINQINGKRYIGSTTKPKDRESLHWRQLRAGKHHSTHLQRAWFKYGSGAFRFEVLERFVGVPLTTLLAAEQRWMDACKVTDRAHGYNNVPLAGSNAGNRMSDEAKARISAAMKGRVFTPEHRAKIAAANTGRKHSSATIAKLQAQALKRPHRKMGPCPMERRAKISAALSGEKNPQFGKPLNEETRKKIGAKSAGRQTFLGRKHTEETKAKMREARLRILALKRASPDHLG